MTGPVIGIAAGIALALFLPVMAWLERRTR